MKTVSIKTNALLNVIKKIANILFSLLVYPYVSRVLGPDNYGKFSFANSIVSYFLLFSMLGIETYVIREGSRIKDDNKKLEKFVSQAFSINIFFTLVCFGLLLVSVKLFPKLSDYKEFLLILSVMIPCTTLGRDYINTIFEDYLYITVRYIAIQIIGIAAIYMFVKDSSDCIIYTAIYAFSSSIGAIVNLFYTRRYIKVRVTANLNLKHHIVPILILFAGQLAINIYAQSDITMLGIMRSDEEVGIYSIASKVYLLTKGIINALTIVIIPRVSYHLGQNDRKKYLQYSNNLFDYLVLMVVPLSIGLLIFSDNVLYIIGGSDYISGSSALKILSLALAVAVFSGFFCNAIMVPNRNEKHFLIATSLSALSNIILNLILIPMIGIEGAAITTLAAEVLVLTLAVILTKSYFTLTLNKRNIISVAISGSAVLIVSLICKAMIDNYIVSLAVAAVLSGIAYFLGLLLMKNNLVIEMCKKYCFKNINNMQFYV